MEHGNTALDRYFAEGDEKAFAEVVKSFLPLVFSAAFRVTGDRPLSEEVAQNVFARLAGLKHGLPSGVPLAAWLHRTTRSTALNVLRSERRRQRREEIAASLAMNESHFPWEKIAPVLDEVIEKLTPQDRELVLSRFFLGESSEELSRRLGLGHEAVRKRLQRALGRLRENLQRRGIETTTAALALSLPAYGVESVGAGLPAIIASSATAAPIAPTAFAVFTAVVMKQSLTISALAILTAGSFWLVSQQRASAALEQKIGNLRQQIALAGADSTKHGSNPGQRGKGMQMAQIDWKHFLELQGGAGDELARRRMQGDMQRRLADMPAEELSDELDRLTGLQLKDDDQLEIEKLLMHFLMEKDPALALNHLEKQLADDRLTPETFMSFRKLLAQNPQQAIGWLDSQIAAGGFVTRTLSEENPTRKWVEGSLLPSLLEKDPDAAMARLMNLPPEQRRGVFAVADILPGTEAAAAKMIHATVPEKERMELISGLVETVAASRDLSRIADFLSRSGATDGERTQIVQTAVSAIPPGDGEDSVARMREIRDFAFSGDPANAPDIVGRSLGNWASKGSFDQAVSLLGESMPGAAADQMIAAFLETPEAVDGLSQAMELLARISDPQKRDELQAKLSERFPSH